MLLWLVGLPERLNVTTLTEPYMCNMQVFGNGPWRYPQTAPAPFQQPARLRAALRHPHKSAQQGLTATQLQPRQAMKQRAAACKSGNKHPPAACNTMTGNKQRVAHKASQPQRRR